MCDTSLCLDGLLDLRNIAFNPLFIKSIKILTDSVLVTKLNDAMVRFHILLWLHTELACCQEVQDGLAVLLNLLFTKFQSQFVGKFFLKIHFC